MFSLLAILVPAALALPGMHHKSLWMKEMVQHRDGFEAIEPQWFTGAIVDHNDQSKGTWKQRYWMNDTIWTKDKSGPIFVYISGEGTGGPGAVQNSEMTWLGEDHGALLLALEHRFYGASYPVNSLDNKALELLSAQQALADVATFVQHIKSTMGATGKVVTFGGSYAGALSSWARKTHGDTIDAALASSGPVQAIVDFTQYMEVVYASLGDKVAGGFAECPSRIRASFEVASRRLASNPTATLKSLGSCQMSLNSSLDEWALWEGLSNPIAGAVQYNLESAHGVADVCSFFAQVDENEPDRLFSALSNLTMASLKWYDMPCNDNNFTSSQIDLISNTSAQPQEEGVGIRQWTWQTCAEFGYYQTGASSDPNSILPVPLTLQGFLDICEIVFGVSNDEVKKNVDASNKFFGGNSTIADHVFAMDGTVDPWHALAVTHQINPNSPSILMEGTAHCRDLQAPSPNDPKPLTDARNVLKDTFKKWL